MPEAWRPPVTMAQSTNKNVVDPLRGALGVVAAGFFFSIMGLCIRFVSSSVNTEMVVFFRNFFGLLCLLPFLARSGWGTVKTNRLPMHFVRTITGLAAMYCFFYALTQLKLAEAVLLTYTAPIFIPIFSIYWLRERVTLPVATAIAIGFIGLLFILKPGTGLFQIASVIGLASGILAAMAFVSIRRLSSTEPILRIVFYFALLSTLISFIPMTMAWTLPSSSDWGLLILIGLLATVGQLCLTYGYNLAPAAQVGPFIYSAVAFAAAWGWLIWKEDLDLWTAFGMALVIIAGYIAMRKRGNQSK